MGATVHPATDRRGTTLPARSRWSVRRRTYVKIAGRWVYLYRAIDQFGQVIDVLVTEKRDLAATRRFFTHVLNHSPRPTEVNTDRAPGYPRVLDELLPSACHITEQYANNRVEADHGRLKARKRPMRGLKRLRSARVICAGHAFVQDLRRGHYELALDLNPNHRLPAGLHRTRPRHLNSTQARIDRVRSSADATAPCSVIAAPRRTLHRTGTAA